MTTALEHPHTRLKRHRPRRFLRWRKAFRDLHSNRTRTALVILSIAVGVFAFGVIAGAREIITRELRIAYRAINPASAIIFTEQPFDQALVDAVRDMPGIAFAEGRRMIPTRVQTGPNEWNDLRLVVVDDLSTLSVNQIYPEAGKWPPADREILLERKSVGLANASVGDTITIKLPNGTDRALPVTGLTHDLNQPPAQIFGIAFGYVTMDTLEWLGISPTFNQLQIRVDGDTDNLAHIEAVTAAVERRIERTNREILRIDIPVPDTHFAEDFIPAILIVLTILGNFSLILSGFLIINTITAILTQQTRQIGVLKAIGARTSDVIGLYFRMVILFGLGALFIAVPLGAIGAFYFSRFISGELNFNVVEFQFQPTVIATVIAAGLLMPILASLVPVLSSARLSVREAISDTGLSSVRRRRHSARNGRLNHLRQRIVAARAATLGRIGSLITGRMSRPLRLSLRNTFRRRGRLAITLITLALGGAIFISVMTLRLSLFATLEDTLGGKGYDVQIQFGRPYRTMPLQEIAAEVPGVTTVEGWRVVQGTPVRANGQEGEALTVNAVPADSEIFTPELATGRWFEPSDRRAVVVHLNLFDKEPQLEIGGLLTLNIDGEESEWHIIGATQDLQPPIGPTLVYVEYADFSHLMGTVGRTDSIHVVTAAHNLATHIAVTRQLEARYDAAGYLTSSNQTASDDRAIFTERFNILTVVLSLMAGLIAIVGSLGLMGTMTINVIERKREIGVMRAIGAADHSILQLFLVEGIIIGLLSFIGAMIIAQPMSRAMSWQIGNVFLGFPLTYLFSFAGAGIWLLIVLVLATVASYWPARNATQVRIRETLAYE